MAWPYIVASKNKKGEFTQIVMFAILNFPSITPGNTILNVTSKARYIRMGPKSNQRHDLFPLFAPLLLKIHRVLNVVVKLVKYNLFIKIKEKLLLSVIAF